MAQRRMFSPDIVCSDAFLDMPTSTQALYYSLGMYADDDGFVNPRKIMRMLGVAEDDLKLLVLKRFVLPFPSGVLVIKHWKINNLVRKDWYRPTQYVDEKNTLFLKENGSYTDNPDNGTKLVNDSLTQVRLGKVSITAANAEKKTKNMKSYNENEHSSDGLPEIDAETREPLQKKENKKTTPEMKKVFAIFVDNPARAIWLKRDIERTAAQALFDEWGIEELTRRYAIVRKHRGEQYCPEIYSPSQFLEKMPAMKEFLKKIS